MKSIIIFGATGNIGAYFVDYCMSHLDPQKYNVIAVGRKKTHFFDKYGVEYLDIDIRNQRDFEKLPKTDVYAVVNLAGLLPAYVETYDPFAYVDTNIIGALNILEYSRTCGVDRVIYSQTWAEQAGYWGKEEVLKPEMPRSLRYTGDHAFYAITKSMVVDTMEYYSQEYGLKKFVFRLPNVYLYSPKQYYFVNGVEKVISYRYMIERAASGKNLEIWGNPEAFKDILYVKDLCKMMYLAIFTKQGGGTYNAGTGIRTTLKEQIEGIVKVFSPHPDITKVIAKPEKPTFDSFVMDITKMERELGYHPDYDYIGYLEDYKSERELKRFNILWEDH